MDRSTSPGLATAACSATGSSPPRSSRCARVASATALRRVLKRPEPPNFLR